MSPSSTQSIWFAWLRVAAHSDPRAGQLLERRLRVKRRSARRVATINVSDNRVALMIADRPAYARVHRRATAGRIRFTGYGPGEPKTSSFGAAPMLAPHRRLRHGRLARYDPPGRSRVHGVDAEPNACRQPSACAAYYEHIRAADHAKVSVSLTRCGACCRRKGGFAAAVRAPTVESAVRSALHAHGDRPPRG